MIKHRISMKRKIQNSMIISSLVSLFILFIILIPVLYTSFIPLAEYISNSINLNISKNYKDLTVMDDRSMDTESIVDIKSISVDELKAIYDWKTNTVDRSNMSEVFEAMEENQVQIVINKMDDDSIKYFLLSIFTTMEDFRESLPFLEYVSEPIILEFKTNGEMMFSIPNAASDETQISGYMNPEKKNLFTSMFQHTFSKIEIRGTNAELLGEITTAVNPNLILFIAVPFILIIIVVVLLTLLFVSILSKILTVPIIKPVMDLNKNLGSIGNNDLSVCRNFNIDIKNPPKEIDELIQNAGLIITKLNDINQKTEDQKSELEAQTEELEAQNIELEEQNLELIKSRDVIQKQQDQLVRTEKMATIGQMYAAIAHEINTPLGAIKSNSQMMQMILDNASNIESIKDDEKIIKTITGLNNANSITVDASKRITEIIKSLKNFSRIDQSEFQLTDIHDGIRSVLTLTSNLWKNKLTIIQDFGDIPNISCYPSMLNQVFMNVIVNAIQATSNGGEILIKTIRDKNDNNVIIRVVDNGVGIKQGLLDIIFESGFTTKDPENGTGLGLSISKEIIDKHNGQIYAESEYGEGTTFTIILPISQDRSN